MMDVVPAIERIAAQAEKNASQSFGDDYVGNRFPSFHIADILAGLIGAAVVWGIIRYRRANAKKFREGVEYGSARWSA